MCIRLITIDTHLDTSDATEQRRSRGERKPEWNESLSTKSLKNDFSMATMEAGRIQNNSLKVMMENNCQLTYLYSAKLPFTDPYLKKVEKPRGK